MRCPSCQHLSKDVVAKFCSQCGHKLLPAAPGAASENKLTAPSAPEGGAECGRELMDSSPFSSLGPGNGQENPDEHCSDASLQIQRGAASEGFMDAADGTSHELEAASPSASKRRKEDAALTKVSDVSSPDPKQANGAAAEPAGPEKGPGKEVKDQTKETKQPRASVPASRDHRQETQTKDQTAVPGGKAGENEKASLKPKKEPKKPEGNNKNNAAAEKNAKEQRNERTGELSPKESPLSSEEGVTVCFHAIISKHFEFNPSQHQVFVRGGEEFGKPKWKRNVCEMYYTRDLHELGSLVEGSAVIARQHLDKPIPYKYVLQKGKGAVEYEFIYKPQQKESEPVNRCLQVKSSLLGSGDWHQYDDIICMNPPGAWQTFKDRFTDGTRKDLVKGKQTAAAIMLDSIFSILETWNAINLKSFFTQFQQFYSVIRVPMIYEGKAQPWSTLEYEEKEVKKHLWECLTKKMEPFLKTSGDPLPKDCPVRSKLRMGLIILFSVEKFHIPLSESDLTSLCHLLCSDPSSPHELHSDLIHILEIKHSWRNSLVNLCQRCMDGEVDLWVCTLPVLHLCMEPSPPTKDAGVQPEDTWAALEGISFSEFREKKSDRKQLVQLMGKNRHLLSVDARLFRSWFSLLPLRTLVCYMRECSEYLSRFPSHILDCLLGTCYRLQELKGPLTNLEVGRLPSAPESWLSRSRPPAGQSQLGGAFSENLTIKSILQMLLSLLDTYQHKMLEEPLIQSYLTVCLKLHETTCRITKDHTFYEMPALSAEIVCRIIILKPLVDSAGGQHSEAGEKNSVATVFQGTLAATRSWFQRVFQNRMFQTGVLSSNVRFTYPEEIKIWRRLVEIHFPVELGWKETLLGDMEGRLKQERPLSQIFAFSSTTWDAEGAEDSVSKCFEKCAIEAVSLVCQSQTSLLEKLSYKDLWKCGTLVSAVITKSWPRSRGQVVHDLGEVLKHLLTWPDIKQLFHLWGTNEEILAHITEEGKKLMGIADSVFAGVTRDLINGTILVGHLELIVKHVDQFLSIWQLQSDRGLSTQEKSMREVLSRRKNELLVLKTEKTHVDALLRAFRRVKDLVEVDFAEIEKRHLEDLNGKRLNDVMTVGSSATSLDPTGTTHYNLSPEVQEMAKTTDLLKESHTFRMFWAQVAKELSETEEMEGQLLQLEEAYEDLYRPCFKRFTKLYQDLKSGEVTFGEVEDIFKDFVNRYGDLTKELRTMCSLHPGDPKDWLRERVRQIEEYHDLHHAVHAAGVIAAVKEDLGLTGDFNVLHTLLSFTVFDEFRHEKLNRISQQLIRAKRLLQDISEPRCQCLRELSLRKEFVGWVQEALGGITELKVFVDLASISAGENDIDVDRVAYFHDAVQGYAPLLYDLDTNAGFDEFMQRLKELWKALDNDQNLPKKLCDSARNLEWLKTVKESHGSVELSSLSLATAINKGGIYVIEAPTDGQKLSPDTVLCLTLPAGLGGREAERDYSLEELKELLNKLMLMSGKKDHSSVEVVEVFSEVFCNVQRLVQSFINLYSAGNVLFRAWTARVYCCPQNGVSVRMDFRLGLASQLVGSGPVAELLEALCRQMEDFLRQWERFVAEKRAEHFYLNYYTAEQLVYLGSELLKRAPSAAALTMLSFIKGNCTTRDVSEACREPDSGATGHQASRLVEELPLRLFSESTLVDKLKVIMEQSMACAPAFQPHCLDLEALGRCLARLARMAGPPVQRELPRGLQGGQPNLVVCGHSEVLPAALAIYMQTPTQPLPTYSEVLLCTPETGFEEVALLLRRCLTPGSLGDGVYCLLFADQLSYEVACRAEALFLDLCTQRHREDYRLVVVCDCEREHCYLPSAFSQHKVLVTPQAPLKDVQAYLAYHFRVPEQTPSAAAVFQDRMCVGVVASERAGVGKSLFVKRLHSRLKRQSKGDVPLKIIRLIDPQLDESEVLRSLLPFLDAQHQMRPVIFHLDVTSSVRTGVGMFLFKLLILQYLMDINGKMWLRNPCHLYVVEILERSSALPRRPSKLGPHVPQFSFLDIFPKVTCRPPKEVINMELDPQRRYREPGMDEQVFRSETFQRPYQYLRRFHQKENLDLFRYQEGSVEGSPGECIQHLLFYCGVLDPSWAELQNFARFLNYQLRDCEASVFCDPGFVGDTLVGFKNFVVAFMIFMARDFATPTLHTSDQSPGNHTVPADGVREEDLAPFSLRKRWESEPHPYVFFNGDHMSMTFIGFHFQANQNGFVDAINPASREVIKRNVMTAQLHEGLVLQKVPFNVDFDRLPRHEKLAKLCLALGIQWPTDPDDTYELTTDNMLKILAIEMRLRCGIPVIVMGETGCGKTRLIRFLSDLRRGGANTDTMKLVKVHGGTTADMIYSKVREAEELARFNREQHQLDTILFFDEANTTEAISCIKEVLCDRTVGGRPLAKDSGLHIIAACNPYRKHSQEMIRRLESAGLGYRVRAEDSAERLGSIPLRQLVYRVHALPPSLLPLVWDFGQLSVSTERLYIQQIVQRLASAIVMVQGEARVVTDVLSASQGFMRARKDECGFVSLRDVERCVKVFQWFYEHSGLLLSQLGAVGDRGVERDPVLWSLVLAVGVCYHASLETKEAYREAVCRLFPEPYNDSRVILDEITRTQDLFLNGVPLRKTIAKNSALKENVFMMVVCIELKIPLFLVGKPGSSKSLAKTIVADAMQGQAAHSDLFRSLKQVHLVSFQCSPHSTPQGIIGTFKQCARFQQGKDLEQYVSVVVLDEVGLAEDSPKMPLKALHPLLEDGCIEDDPAPHKKVGFVGISNWALDPAKMNRGIFVSRGSPTERELIESARGICASEPLVQERIQGYFAAFAKAYETVCESQDKEFFGLRDYYSLIKMVFAAAKASNREPSSEDIARAVLRNFSGKDDIQALAIFSASLPEAKCAEDVSTMELIRQNMYGDLRKAPGPELEGAESRYLLVLTRNYVALQILQQAFFADDLPEVIFGSSFPRDQEYTQICRNINRVKICMETGRMVVLLNLQNLYESLYDALNQYYVYLGGQKYVDLGLGTHRVKCRVHPDFRLIVIEEKDVVYQRFPIPLINRLEKHYLDIHTVLERWQKAVVEDLKGWVEGFIHVKAEQLRARPRYSPADVFIGYHSDTCASVVLQAVKRRGPRALTEELYQEVLDQAKLALLDCATPDAVVRLNASSLGGFTAKCLSQEYYHRQQHDSFADFLQAQLRPKGQGRRAVFTEVTTFSRLLTSHDCELLESELKDRALKLTVLSLQQFDTEYAFLKDVRNCLTHPADSKILIIQTDFEDGVHSAQLIASAKYSAINEINKMQGNKDSIFVYFITKLSRMASGTSYVGFHGGLWQSVHIDDLRRSTIMVSDVTKLQGVAISQLFKPDDGPELEAGCGAQDSGEELMETEAVSSGEAAEADMETESSKATDSPTPEPVQILDTTSLLRSCIQGAVGKLRDQNAGFERSMQRVSILLSLLDTDSTHTAAFLAVAKMRLYVLLKKQEESSPFSVGEWVVREASNQDALQEAGTFRHTLWKRVQSTVTPLLASMISFIDRDGNLELLASPDSPSWARDLWMFIFSDVKLLNIPVVTSDARSRGEMAYITVQNDMNRLENSANSVPFSWRIKEYLEDLWIHTQYIKGDEGPAEKLVELFRQTPLGRFLAQLSAHQRQDLLQGYLRDFLLLTTRVSTQEELEVLQMALWSCIHQLKAKRPEEEVSLPSVHLAHHHFRSRLQNFSRILAIHPPVVQSLLKGTQNHSWAGHEMALDALAALACVEMLTGELLEPRPQAWQAWLQTVKNLSMPLELLCSDGYTQDSGKMTRAVIRDIRTHWNRLFSVSLFVEHVLLGTKSQIPELLELVTSYVSLLNKCLEEDADLKTHRPFVAVMTALRKCKDQASVSFTRPGVRPCPVCLGDAQDPVCLPCDCVFCLRCLKARLTLGQMGCPRCVIDLPDDFSLTVSQEHREIIRKHACFRQMCNSFFVDLVSTMCFKDNSPPEKRVVEDLLSLLFVEKELLRESSQRSREHTKSLSPFDDVVDKTPVIRSVVLKLLLKYSFRDVKDYIQAYLSQLEMKPFLAKDKGALYILFSSCLEDSIREKNSAFSTADEWKRLREEGQFLKTYPPEPGGPRPAREASVEYLQQTARARLCLDKAAELLSELQDGSGRSPFQPSPTSDGTRLSAPCPRSPPSSRTSARTQGAGPCPSRLTHRFLPRLLVGPAEVAEEKCRYLKQVELFCTRVQNDWYRVYLVRKLASQQGMEFVQSLSRRDHPAHWVFPRELLAQQEDDLGQMDRYLVHGDDYKALRDTVAKAILKGEPLAVRSALKACGSSAPQQAVYLLLALFREVTTLYRSHNANLHPKPQQCEALKKVIEEIQALSPDVRSFATSLVTNELPLLTPGPGDSILEGTVTEMAVHTAVLLLCGQSQVLEPLRNLAFSPRNMANAFLPTMPEDLLAQAKNWKGLESVRWYTCPNGHACSVGECGMPMEQSHCIDCGAPVGGINHKPNSGFHVIQNTEDRTQTGHVLGSPPPRGAAVVSDRELSPAVFLLLRLLTHLSMLWGAAQSAQEIIHIIKPLVRDPKAFLQQHIQRDLEQLTRMLGKSADETVSVVHLVLGRLLAEQGCWGSLNFDAQLSTREKRNSWEKLVATIILPELEHLDKTLRAVNTRISQDERLGSNPVAKIVYGDPAAFLPGLPQQGVVHCSRMWSCRKRVTVEHLQHIVEQRDGRETVPVLWKFLQKEAELRLVKFLPEILALQKNLVKRFQNVSEVEYSCIRSFISSHSSDGLKQLYQNRIATFLSTWNKLRRSLETNGEIKLPAGYCSSDLDLDADLEVILPRRQGLGLCSTALVSYLISLHNEMVYAVEKLSQEDSSYSVDASEVADVHVVSYEPERDLMPLVLSNCQYHVEQGGETSQEFDLEKIQRQIVSRFLQGKPRLTLKGLPTLVFRRDWNYEHLFMEIRNKMPQHPLPNSVIGAIRGQLQSYSDACEALSAIEVALGFLSTAGGDPNMPLNDYIQNRLGMGDQALLVSQALNRCQLRHSIALWQFLSAHKSELLLRLKKEPFGEIGPSYKEDLCPQNAKLLSTFLNQAGLDAFLLELHEMMVLKLKNPRSAKDFNPQWSLRDTLVSYMETKGSDIPPEMESQFPEEILLSHCVSVWKKAAELKWNRHTR